jgi:hypothetical protein
MREDGLGEFVREVRHHFGIGVPKIEDGRLPLIEEFEYFGLKVPRFGVVIVSEWLE